MMDPIMDPKVQKQVKGALKSTFTVTAPKAEIETH